MPRLLREMVICGFIESDIKDAVMHCLTRKMIEVDTSSEESIRENDCVKATASAWAHLRILPSRLEYLSAVLPSTPINDSSLAAIVYDTMQAENRSNSIHEARYIHNVKAFLAYFQKQVAISKCHPGFKDRKVSGSEYVIAKIEDAIAFSSRRQRPSIRRADLLDTV